MSMIKTNQLSVGYHKHVVVEDVALNVERGQMVCLLGPNGSGKSTILRTLAGLLAPVKGNVQLKGLDAFKADKKKFAKVLSVVLTERPNSGLMTVFDLVAMGRHPHTGLLGKLKKQDVAVIEKSLKAVHAFDLVERYFMELSDGEKQKVLLARALAQEPEIMILDEPTMHLDVNHKIEVVSILKKLCREEQMTVVLSLHEIELAKKSCDYVLLINEGKIQEAGYPEKVIRDESIQKLYGIQSAKYNDLLETIEFAPTSKQGIFIVGGNGAGAKILRLFNKKGIAIIAGVLHENDIDYHVALSLETTIIKEKAYNAISEEAYNTAIKHIKQSDCLIDSGTEFNEGNSRNKALIQAGLDQGIPVYSLRSKAEREHLFGEKATQMIGFKEVNALVAAVKQHVEAVSE